MQLDTGPINSNMILGINSPPQDQIDLRRVTTCAPITQANYTITFTSDTFPPSLGYILPGDKYIAYTYGAAEGGFLGTNITVGASLYVANATASRSLRYLIVFHSPPIVFSPRLLAQKLHFPYPANLVNDELF
jgi:hypothetical protein